MENCWDIKRECPFRGADPAEAKCPVYSAQVPCWEFDWIEFQASMPAGPEKDEWTRTMLEWCPACAVRTSHESEVDSLVARLREA